MSRVERLAGRERLTTEQRATLADIDRCAEWRDEHGLGSDWIATETATGDPVIYVYDQHDAFVLRADGMLVAEGKNP